MAIVLFFNCIFNVRQTHVSCLQEMKEEEKKRISEYKSS